MPLYSSILHVTETGVEVDGFAGLQLELRGVAMPSSATDDGRTAAFPFSIAGMVAMMLCCHSPFQVCKRELPSRDGPAPR